MTLDEAKVFLNTLFRSELVDHTFGDAEVYWSNKEEDDDVAFGYYGRSGDEVTINADQENHPDGAVFVGEAARELRCCGKISRRTRNDNAD